jgi:hypothetical protein
MRGTQGALIVASTLQIILGFSGLWRIVVRFVYLFSLRLLWFQAVVDWSRILALNVIALL